MIARSIFAMFVVVGAFASQFALAGNYHQDQFQRAERKAQEKMKSDHDACIRQQVQNFIAAYQQMEKTKRIPIYRGRNLTIVSAGPAPSGTLLSDWHVEVEGKGFCKISPRLWTDHRMFPSISCPSVGYQDQVGPLRASVPGC